MEAQVQMQAITLVGSPRGFLDRPEFQPKVPLGGPGGPKTWLPRDPRFEPRMAQVTVPVARDTAALFRDTRDRLGIPRSERARENLDRIERGEARLVITGQQPGFLTGPLYTVFKAASACAAAEHLSTLTGAPHVPVFWVASEDHDLDEARTAAFPGPDGATVEFSLPHPADRRPLSAYAVDRAAEETIDRALASLEGRRFAGESRALADLYRGRTLAGGFAAMISRLFEGRGLLIIDPESLRSRAATIIARCLEDPAALLERIEAGIREVEALGLRAQVPERFPLFHLAGGKRQHLEPEDGGRTGRFLIEGTGETVRAADLLDTLGSRPGLFSPGVLLRPVVQNALLPNAVYIGGSAEIAYFAQLGPVFEWFGLPPPGIALRLSATLIEGKTARALRRLRLWPLERPAARRWRGAQRAEDLVPAPEDDPGRRLEELAGETAGSMARALADPRLPAAERERLEASAQWIAGEIRKLSGKASRVVRQAATEDLLAAARVWGAFFPDGVLQERRWNVVYHVAKYGTGWIDDLVEGTRADPFRVDHRWAFFGEEE